MAAKKYYPGMKVRFIGQKLPVPPGSQPRTCPKPGDVGVFALDGLSIPAEMLRVALIDLHKAAGKPFPPYLDGPFCRCEFGGKLQHFLYSEIEPVDDDEADPEQFSEEVLNEVEDALAKFAKEPA